MSILISLNVLIMGLELLDFSTSGQALSSLDLLNSGLSLQSSIEKNLISVAFHLLSLLSKLLLSGVVTDQLEVSLTMENESLVSIHLLLLLFDGPLLLKHRLLSRDELFLLIALNLTSVLLPIQNGHGVSDFLLFLTSLSHFSFELLLGI